MFLECALTLHNPYQALQQVVTEMTTRNPIVELFTKDFDRPSDMLCCAFGLRSSEIDAYFSLIKKKKTVKELAEDINRDRSTVQRILKKLLEKNLVTKETHHIDRGGHFFEYKAVSTKEVRKEILKQLDDWYESTRRFLLSSWSERTE